MKRINLLVVIINLFGLLAVQGMESWRPGVVGAVVSIPFVGLMAVGLITLSRWPPQRPKQLN